MYQELIKPVQREFEEYGKRYKESLVSGNRTLVEMFDKVYESSGKQMRPILLLLAAQASGGTTEASIDAAISMELLHLATLIHDDVVDEADMRRGRPSINSLFDNKIAVLGGDYVLSSALKIAIGTGNTDVLEIITALGKSLCEGEIMQYLNAKNRIFDEQAYYDVIDHKTAALFSACVKAGITTSRNPDCEIKDTILKFGRIVGLCFQIRDDIFDYSPDAKTGKPNGKDLEEGKMTLPLIYVYNTSDNNGKKRIIAALDNKQIADLQKIALEQGGLSYASDRLEQLKQEAIALLGTTGGNPATDALEKYICYITDRNK